ncbi:MAG: tRNA 5-methoxyuridine(34)/uridine 5-oxyacetic acid(34) synthase CmoB [Methylococcaceae bacterium]|jgi:tRNA (mo5U34)-methyltransferase
MFSVNHHLIEVDNYQALIESLNLAKAESWANLLPSQLETAFDLNKHGHLTQWLSLIDELPIFSAVQCQLNTDTVSVSLDNGLSNVEKNQLSNQLQLLHPWRKGPYDIFGIFIDTEWRSDWKWNRLEAQIAPLANRLVLDVGCGNGYHCWRMLGEGARLVVGIDPMLLNVMQFLAIKKLMGSAPIYVLPLGIEHVPPSLKVFDTVFSMGVLYHRKSPIEHLQELRDCLRPGGELVLETIVVDGPLGLSLMPEDRYACMRNVWFLPSCETLLSWLKRCGFINIRLIDVSVTNTQEQRSTDWMRFRSLKDYLDPQNPALTIEGLPAPKRAIFIANAA